eukprot:365429-Chlamydomonas_euryale.AAC.10
MPELITEESPAKIPSITEEVVTSPYILRKRRARELRRIARKEALAPYRRALASAIAASQKARRPSHSFRGQLRPRTHARRREGACFSPAQQLATPTSSSCSSCSIYSAAVICNQSRGRLPTVPTRSRLLLA